ncbi:MAG: hypothetical protein V1484_01485 [bacterium]
MSNNFFFRFIATSRLTFSDWKIHQEKEQKGVKNNYSGDGDDAEMMVYDKRIKKNDFFHHYGLGFDIKIKAQNKEEARKKVETLMFNFIGIICFLEKCYIESPVCILSYRYPIDTKKELGEYQASLIDNDFFQPNESSLRPINYTRLDIFIKKIIVTSPEIRDTIYFALHWFWKAVGTKDKRDRFINLWVSLEILEPLLKNFYNQQKSKIDFPLCLHCMEKFTQCPKCNKNFGYTHNVGFTGFKKLEKNILDESVLKFQKLHSCRSALVHSGGNISKEDLEKAIFSIQVLINCSILKLLKLSEDYKDGILMAQSPFRSISLPKILEFKGSIIVNQLASIDNIDKQPSVEAEYSYKFYIDEKSGELICNYDVKHIFNNVFKDGKVEKVLKVDSSQEIKEVWERKD